MTPSDKLRSDLRGIVRHWLFHDQGKVESLADAFYDYIIDTYGPPF